MWYVLNVCQFYLYIYRVYKLYSIYTLSFSTQSKYSEIWITAPAALVDRLDSLLCCQSTSYIMAMTREEVTKLITRETGHYGAEIRRMRSVER